MMERIIGFAIYCLFIAFLGMLEWLVCRDIDKRFGQKQSDRERQVQTGTKGKANERKQKH